MNIKIMIIAMTTFGLIKNVKSCEHEENMGSISYYNKNFQIFYERTIDADFSPYYSKFIPELPSQSKILDVGCGVGRDARYFESLGYQVVAFDGSEEMVLLANKIMNEPCRLMLYTDMDFSEEFDGVWAAASLIHVPNDELENIIIKIYNALKRDGVFFATFKHGSGHYTQEERTFYYMTEDKIREHLSERFSVLDIWKTEDLTSHIAHSPDRTWLNILVRKI